MKIRIVGFSIFLLLVMVSISALAQDDEPKPPDGSVNDLISVPLSSDDSFSTGESMMASSSTRYVICPPNWKGVSVFVVTGNTTSLWAFTDGTSYGRFGTCNEPGGCQFIHIASRPNAAPWRSVLASAGTILSHTASCSP